MTRREFLDRSGQLAIGLGALQIGARSSDTADELTLANDSITGVWTTTGGVFRPARFTDTLNRTPLPVPAQAFTLTFADKTTLAASEMRITAGPRTEMLVGNANASRKVEQFGGRQVTMTLQDSSGRIEVVWRGLLRDGSRYIRQEISLRALGADIP